ETYEDVLDRMLKGLDRYLKKYPHKNIVIFSHAAPIKFLRAYFKNIQTNQIKNLKVTNASISMLKFNDDHFIGESYKEIYPRAEEFY
ncbi:histidine phosphatase family protein, partial [Patescibacteria group bacterium]|nr:histidine phosphatase family protein [Patescibacteria group bacterium]